MRTAPASPPFRVGTLVAAVRQPPCDLEKRGGGAEVLTQTRRAPGAVVRHASSPLVLLVQAQVTPVRSVQPGAL